MGRKVWILNLLFFVPLMMGPSKSVGTWIVKKQNGYRLCFTSADINNVSDYNRYIINGIKLIDSFFKNSIKNDFDVYIHPNRYSLDSTWQKNWMMPEFKSDCWMVASGTGSRLDMITPKKWDTEACEHRYTDTVKTQQLITHELVHVFHGQINISHDFSNLEGMDWFVEGLATYVSGQFDSTRIEQVKAAISGNNLPELEDFWTGKLKYALSGSLVMFIDTKYGRSVLKKLLQYNKKSDILATLGTTESKLLSEWKIYILSL